MLVLYNISIFLYSFLAKLIAPFNKKALLWTNGRNGIFQRIEEAVKNNVAPVAWFHCASLGEFEQARPVIEKFRKLFPAYKILLTFFSPSGYEIRKNYTGADYVFYLPSDTRHNAARFIKITKPRIALFTKYEFWYHYLNELKKMAVPIFLFSAIFREDQLFFRPYGTFYKNFLLYFDKIFVQDIDSVNILNKYGISQTLLAGDTRFDRVLQIAHQKKEIPEITAFKGSHNLFIAGSTWPEDVRHLMPLIHQHPDLKIIIAPHEVKEEFLTQIEKQYGLPSVRFSCAAGKNLQNCNLLIVDNIGMLSSLYQYAAYAYIGGGFGKGIHNILEAAVCGLPVFFGLNYRKFKEAVELMEKSCAFPSDTSEILIRDFKSIYPFNEKYHRIRNVSKEYVLSRSGGTEIILNHCSLTLNQTP
jgi:3-deoxy-D-manno-octulosonic-acid transferase